MPILSKVTKMISRILDRIKNLPLILGIRIELLHYTSFGHPFYQHELACWEKKKWRLIVFIMPNNYPHLSVVRFLQKDFIVCKAPLATIRTLQFCGIVKQNYKINPAFNYSENLAIDNRSSALAEYQKITPRYDIIICDRPPATEDCTLKYPVSSRSFTISEVGFAEEVAEEYRMTTCSNTFQSANSDCAPPFGADLTITKIASSRIYFGTNTGPYVCAQSLRKDCFLFNVIPFLGTHSYHKVTDCVLPAIIAYRNNGQLVDIATILRNGIYLLDDQELKRKGLIAIRHDWELVKICWREYLSRLLCDAIIPTASQRSFQNLIQRYTSFGSPVIVPNSYIAWLTRKNLLPSTFT